MIEKANKKGIRFVPVDTVSKEAMLKLNELMTRKEKSLIKLVADYKAGILVPQN